MVSKFERGKDSAQDAVESTATAVGRIATIITTAVAEVTREIGGILTQGFEMREAAKRARLDDSGARPVTSDGGTSDGGTSDGGAPDGGAPDGGAAEPREDRP